MAKTTLTDIASLSNETSVVNTINNNNAAIETAFDNTLSRDGSSPNAMNASLDMNNQRILNLPPPTNPTDPVRLADLTYTTLPGTIVVPTPSLGNAQRLVKINTAGTQYVATNVAVDDSNNILSLTSLASFGTAVNPWGACYIDGNGRIEFGSDSNSVITRSASGILNFNTSLVLGTSGYLELKTITAPATPASGLRVYSKTASGASHLHIKDSAGTETRLSYPVATLAQEKAATSTEVITTPGIQVYHPGHPKAWATVNGGITPSILASYGVQAAGRPGLGRLLVTMANAMSSTSYCVVATVTRTTTALTEANVLHVTVRSATQTTTTFELECIDNTTGTCVLVDPTRWHFIIFGDLA